ncbi:MAG: GNAT family N-acetyltransferase [Anaerolineae bacterium]|nr:GNAT family N-acetyltransferase [Anaerolineae bacterium]
MAADLLVKLYTLPALEPVLAQQRAQGIEIRRAIAPEKHVVVNWIQREFGDLWASETEVAYSNTPISCIIAVENEKLIGFACYDATCRGFFGPTGVTESLRGRGTGKALLLACLHTMHTLGYGYGIIGAAGPVEFYQKIVGAIPIPDSWPGIYRGILKAEDHVD